MQFVFGIGLALLLFFLQYIWKIMPSWVAWFGFSFSILLILWGAFGISWGQRMAVGPILLFIASVSGIVGSIAWYTTQPNGNNRMTTSESQEQKENFVTRRMGLIKQWRNGIESIKDSDWYLHSMDTVLFRNETWYSSLRQYMTKEAIENLERPRTLTVPRNDGEIPKKIILLDEVARIEKEWGLTGYSKQSIKKLPEEKIDITAFDSANRIILHNSGDHKVFVSHLSLRSVEHGHSRTILIEKTIDSKDFLTYDLKEPNMDLKKWQVRSISEESWQQLLLSYHLKDTECIHWHFFISDDPGYQTIKKHLGSDLHEIPINATLYFRSIQDGHQINQNLKVVAVPFLNQECVAPNGTFRFQ